MAPQPASGRSILTGPVIVGRRGRESPLLSAAISPRDGPFQGGPDPWSWGLGGDAKVPAFVRKGSMPKEDEQSRGETGAARFSPLKVCADALSLAARAHLVS
jgi:hypothetical protein